MLIVTESTMLAPLIVLIATVFSNIVQSESSPNNTSDIICNGTFNINGSSMFSISGNLTCFPKFVTSSEIIRFEVVYSPRLIMYFGHFKIYDGLDDKSPVLWDVTYKK